MKTIERLQQFIISKGMSFNAFDNSINASNGYIGKAIKTKGSIGSDVIEKIISVYPELNIIWLITGEGNMFKSAYTPHSIGLVNSETATYGALPPTVSESELHEKLHPVLHPVGKNDRKSTIIALQKQSEERNKLTEKNINTPKIITLDQGGNENILYVPVKARAGYLNGYGDPEFISSLPTFRFPGLNNATFRMFEVEGPSMAPVIQHNDRVIGEWVDGLHNIRENRVHIVVTHSQGVVVKRVMNRIAERGKIVLRSDTISHRKDYPTIQIDPEDIIEIWYSRLKISGDFSEPAEIYHRINSMEADITDLREINGHMSYQLKQVFDKLNIPSQ